MPDTILLENRIAALEAQLRTLSTTAPRASNGGQPSSQQVRITELPAATQANDTDLYEVSQAGTPGNPATSRRITQALLKAGVRPDLSPYLTGIVPGPGIKVGGRAPVVTVSLDAVGTAGDFGDDQTVPRITTDDYGRVTGVVLVPILGPDLGAYAPLDSPAFVGSPTAPLQPRNTNDATLANCAFVMQEIASLAPDLSGFAPLASPHFTGIPLAPTAAVGTATDQLSTCNFVQQAIASGASISVGEVAPFSPRANQLWWHSGFGQMFIYFSDVDSSQWVPASPAMSTVGIPPGSSTDYFGGTVPGGWYLCDGSLKNRITDAPLFAAIGTTYGAGDGSTTFALPDCRGRVLAMVDGGSGRLTGFTNVGQAGGEQAHVLAVGEMPSHAHAGPVHAHTLPPHGHTGRGAGIVGNYLANGTSRAVGTGDGTNSGYFQDISVTIDNAGAIGTDNGGSGAATSAAGGGAGHNVVQPTMAVNKLIKR